jgi:O-methyltransferase involved in polyketide biosynthesis
MKGLTYHLSPETLSDLFSAFAKLLPKGSIVAYDLWGPDSDD